MRTLAYLCAILTTLSVWAVAFLLGSGKVHLHCDKYPAVKDDCYFVWKR